MSDTIPLRRAYLPSLSVNTVLLESISGDGTRCLATPCHAACQTTAFRWWYYSSRALKVQTEKPLPSLATPTQIHPPPTSSVHHTRHLTTLFRPTLTLVPPLYAVIPPCHLPVIVRTSIPNQTCFI